MWNPSQIDGPVLVPITAPGPVVDGVLTTVITGYQPGYHLNIDPALMVPELEPYRVTPAEPTRVFAGQTTVFLRFTDEAEARALCPDAWWVEINDEH